MSNVSLKSAAWNVFLKFVIIGVFAIIMMIIGILPYSFFIGILSGYFEWIVLLYLILVIEEYAWG
jgi:hypothetical protein